MCAFIHLEFLVLDLFYFWPANNLIWVPMQGPGVPTEKGSTYTERTNIYIHIYRLYIVLALYNMYASCGCKDNCQNKRCCPIGKLIFSKSWWILILFWVHFKIIWNFSEFIWINIETNNIINVDLYKSWLYLNDL